MRKYLSALCCLAVALTAVSTVQADIVVVGSIIDEANVTRTGSVNGTIIESEVNQWSDATFAKSLDIDGDNIYGTDGVFLVSTTAQNAGQGTQTTFERVPTFTMPVVASGINFTGNFQNPNGTTGFIQNDANDAIIRLGYAGFNNGTQGEAIPLTDLYTYTLTADQAADETLRLGVFGGTNNSDPRLGFTDLQVTAGGVESTIVQDPRDTNTGNAADLYFFDITGLVAGDTIVISAANSNSLVGNFNAATIGGVTFDTAITAIPEPSSLALLGLVGIAGFVRRRR